MSSYLSVHTLEKPYTCGHCGDSFTLLALLKKHMLVHTEEKTYSYDSCFKEDMLVHTEEKTYSYDPCFKEDTLVSQKWLKCCPLLQLIRWFFFAEQHGYQS